ncbi:hypothetical protein RND81_12G126600 [Saponaria officinalis]|uniref:Uncharacterized protein n=1 Tax=Saponaria officinalis TaxID=3572 RepID=A0AAW1H9T7_SAPOF
MDIGTVLSAAQTLLAALQCSELKELWSMLGYKSELEKLEQTVFTIKAVLLDADSDKKVVSEEAKVYIGNLKEAVFEADDLFDKVATLAGQRGVEGNKLLKKVRFAVSHFKQLFLGDMSRKIKRASNKLDEIASNHKKFGFSSDVLYDHASSKYRREESCSHAYSPTIIGREADVENIVRLLIESDFQEHVSFLTIVGVGGLGKTTLAQLVLKDERISRHFPTILWAGVSDHDRIAERLNLLDILGNVLESATGKRPVIGSSLDNVQRRLRAQLAGKRFLLVLDDVWSENRNELIRLAGFLTGGLCGSQVLVTSRSQETARLIGSGRPYVLQGLSEEQSWELFTSVAFEGGNPPDEFVQIGQEIVKWCTNVPFVISVVGSYLYGQRMSKWESLRRSGPGIIDDDSIRSVLKLSYNHLKTPLRSCFSHCALFPRNFEIHKETLIGLWMAQGYVLPSDNGHSIDDVAEDYFSTLVRRFFFHDAKKDEYGEIISFKVHDLMYDIAKEVSAKEICEVNPNTPRDTKAVRHFAVKGHEFMNNSTTKTRIRTYLQVCRIGGRLVLDKLLANSPSLRTLDLRGAKIEILPNSIGNLLHLRYLDLSFNEKMKVLPKTITKLHNLQTLNLIQCKGLKVLPTDLSKLVNLRVFDVMDCFLPMYMPQNFGKLTFLHKLDRFGMGDLNPSNGKRFDQLDDLKALVNLKGSIGLQIRSSPSAPYQAQGGAYLSTLEHLSGVEIWYARSVFPEEKRFKEDVVAKVEDEEATFEYEEAILEDLQPHSNLKYLRLVEYRGKKLPTWACEHNLARFLPNLVKIELQKCVGLHYLPYLGLLRKLKTLRLEILPNMEYLTNDVPSVALVPGSSTESSSLFPCLEHLYLEDLPKLKGWWPISQAGDDNSQVSPPCLPQLRGLWIYQCPEMASIPLCPLVDDLRICDKYRSLELKALNRNISQKVLPSSSSVTDSKPCPKEMRLSTGNVELLKLVPRGNLQCLKEMRIESDYKLRSLSEVEYLFKTCLSSLELLEIWRCPKLESLSGGLEHLTALQKLHIRKTAELLHADTSDNNGGVPWSCIAQTLQSLKLEDLPQLANLPGGMHRLTSLESLSIVDCKGLASMPKWMPKLSSLRKLEVKRSCTELKERCQDQTGEDWLNIQHICDISITEE